MTEKSLVARVRDSITADALPRQKPLKTWVGYGGHLPCEGCGDPILAAQVQYDLEMADGQVFRLHTGCHGLWLGEMIRRRAWAVDPAPR